MAAKTERITVRVNSQQMRVIDAMIMLGEVENRSLAVRAAIKEFVAKHTPDVSLVEAQKKKEDKLTALAAKVEELQKINEP